MKYTGIIILLLTLIISSCSNRNQDLIMEQKYKQLSGTYTGLLPCENCPGIWYTLDLEEDKTYKSYAAYQNIPDLPFVDSGRFIIFDMDKISLQKEKKGHAFFLVLNNSLEILDAAGNRVTSDITDMYRLKKVDPERIIDFQDLEGQWILTEIFDNEIRRNEISKLPFLYFKTDQRSVSGNAGCNNIISTFVTEGDILLFNPFISTKMDCGDPIEQVFLESLMGPLRYDIKKGILILSKNDEEILKFRREN